MKFYLDMVGCRLNQAEIEEYASRLYALGHELVAEPENADVAILNTCTVTTAAASDSRQKVRQIHRRNEHIQVVLTGCWSTLEPEKAFDLPGVTQVIPNSEKDFLVNKFFNLPRDSFDLEPLQRDPIPGSRLRTRAFIKVQDGCDNRCTFCITTIARGASHSRSIDRVIKEIKATTSQPQQGDSTEQTREIVLTGVHLGSWGHDLSPKDSLAHMVKKILEETDVPRIRLSSVEPWDISPEFFQLWENPRLCRQLHLPLQSGSGAVLRRMARKTTPHAYARLIQTARAAIPDLAITTDVIAGFPGETESEFEESLDFIKAMQFAGGHVFTYSPRHGTAAATMPDQVPHPIRKERNAKIRAVLHESQDAFYKAFLGKTLNVLWESETKLDADRYYIKGLTDNYIRVEAIANKPMRNQITKTLMINWKSNLLVGHIIEE